MVARIGFVVPLFVGLVGVVALPAPVLERPAAAAPEPSRGNVEEILSRFRNLAGLEAHFREEKVMGLLAAPLVSEGTLHFQPPGKLARHTLTPRKSSAVIEGHRILAWDGKKTAQIDVGASPVAAAFVESFGQLLSGDLQALERTFRLERAPTTAPGWEIVLVPRGEPLSKSLREIRFRGEEGVVKALVLVEQNGDRTSMTFSAVNPNRKYSLEEAARVFRVPD